MNTAPASFSCDFSAQVDADAAAFDAWASDSTIATRTVARLRARGLDVEWCTGDAAWQSRRSEKVGCFTGRGIFRHTEYTAHFDVQGLSADGGEVVVRVRASRLGKNGKLHAEILVGAYVGGGTDACGREVRPRFLHASRNAPEVAAARALLGLK